MGHFRSDYQVGRLFGYPWRARSRAPVCGVHSRVFFRALQSNSQLQLTALAGANFGRTRFQSISFFWNELQNQSQKLLQMLSLWPMFETARPDPVGFFLLDLILLLEIATAAGSPVKARPSRCPWRCGGADLKESMSRVSEEHLECLEKGCRRFTFRHALHEKARLFRVHSRAFTRRLFTFSHRPFLRFSQLS